MIARHLSGICAAAWAVSGLAVTCQAMPRASEVPPRAASKAQDGLARRGIWVTYSAAGLASSTTPNGDGTQTVSTGDLRWPILSVRLGSATKDRPVDFDLLTPAGFHRHDILAADLHEEEMSGDPYSDAELRGRRLKQALMHHRPILRVRIDAGGRPHVESSPELSQHEACAHRLLRTAVEAQLAAAEEEEQRQDQQEQLRDQALSRSVSPPLDSAALLLRLARLPLTDLAGAFELGPAYRDEGSEPSSSQRAWRAKLITAHGRAVRSEIDLRSAPDSPAASVCRLLAFESAEMRRIDSCIIEGVFDRRDGWPIRLTVSRKGESSNGATEAHYRSFERLAPLQGFVPPPNPCPVRL